MTDLKVAADKIRYLVETEKNEFVRRVVGEIKEDTLDSHFLIRAVEVMFSYEWDGVMEKFNAAGLKSLCGEAQRRARELETGNRERVAHRKKPEKLENIFYWGILADFGFTEPRNFASVLQQYSTGSGAHSPLRKSERWAEKKSNQLEPFLEDLAQGKGGTQGQQLYHALQRTREAQCNLGFLNRKAFYRTLMNCYALSENYEGSYKTFLLRELSDILEREATWQDVHASKPEDWEKTKPWKKLFGMGENIFFYLLRDIDFGAELGTSTHGFVKLDSQKLFWKSIFAVMPSEAEASFARQRQDFSTTLRSFFAALRSK